MGWKKLRHIFTSEGQHPWMISHAANPFGAQVKGNIMRTYITTRDADNRSHIAFVDLDLADNFNVIAVSDNPVLVPGEPGMFDDSGVAMGFLLEEEDETRLYYLGWNLKVTVPWLNTIGLALLDKSSGEFRKYSRAPIMDRSDEDPFSISYPSILKHENNYRMWYGSNLRWGKDQSEMQHVIKHAVSKDGYNWKRSRFHVMDLEHPGEYALSKPFVHYDLKTGYEMWYSYRASENSDTYRIGYATSPDGIAWSRKDDKASIDVSQKGWDSEMICYPFVFHFEGKRYMLYNGNGYGKLGFGVAVYE